MMNLREPLYFEVEVEVPMNSDPRVVLKLEYCWATLKEDRKSQPRWNLIINGLFSIYFPAKLLKIILKVFPMF